MGDISPSERARRFVSEFEKDFVEIAGFDDGQSLVVHRQHLVAEDDGKVFYETTLRKANDRDSTNEYVLREDVCVFDTSADDYYAKQLSETLGIELTFIKQRLRKAGVE